MSKKLSQDSELQTLTLSPSSPNSPPLPPLGHHTEQFGPHCFNNPSSSHEVGQKERSAGNAKPKNEKCEKGSSHNAKAKHVDDDSTAAQTGRVSSGGQAGKVSSGGQAGKIGSSGQAGRVSSAGQAGRVSTGGQAGRVSSGGSGHTTSTRSASKDANSSSAATNVTVMLQQAPPPSQMAAHHSKQHQSLVQSSSMQNTPKQKTERVLSAPGKAAAVITSSKAHNRPMDTRATLDSNIGPLFHPHQSTQQQHPTRLVPHHPPLAATTRNRAPQPNVIINVLTTHGGGVRSDGTPASGRSAGSPLPQPPSSTRGSATSSPFRQYVSSTSFPAPPQRSPPQAERIELGYFRNHPAQVSTLCASHTTASDSSPYVGPTVATTIASHSVALPPHLVTRLNPTIPVPGSELVINCIGTPTSSVNTLTQSSSQPQQNTISRPFSAVVPGKTLTTPDLVSIQSASETLVSRAPQPAPGRSSHPIKLESLQGNITLHIKPEAIHSTNTRPAHTALLIEPDSGPGFLPSLRLSPGKRVAISQSSSSRGETSYASTIVPGASMPSEPLCPSTEATICGNIGGGNEKPTSLLTQLLSQSTKGSSSRSASDILKFWTDSIAPKKPNFGSNVALAGSNGSNSDSNSSELSESSNAGKSLLQSDCFYKNSSTVGFTSGLASESSSTQAFGSRSSLNPSASAGNFFLPRKETRNNFVSEESHGLLMNEPLLEPRYHKDWFATELSKFTDENPLDVMGSAQAPLNPDSLPDDDDDEAWFDSVTKLNEQWFRPGKNSATSSIAMTATPVGKSDVARMSGFGGMGRNRGGAAGGGGGGSSSLIGRSSTATDLHQKMGSLARLESSSSYAGLATPLAGLSTRGLSTTTPQSALTLSTKPTRSTLDLANLNCDKSGASNSSTNATFGSNAALANTSTSNLSARYGNLNLASNRSNMAGLRKVHHQRGLYQRRLHNKTHANLIKTNIDDAGAVKEIEAGLLHLMEEFQAGNLAAFGKDSRLRQMEAIREQQESLARLHQEVGVRQDLYQPLSAEGLQSNSEHMSTLMGKLECLSEAIENLHSNASCDRKTSTSDATVVPSTAGGTSSSHTVDDKRGTTSNAKEDTVDDAGVELRKKSNNRGILHKTSSLGGAGSGGRENGVADVAATDGNGAFVDRSRISKGGGASFVRSSSQKHMEYSRAPAAAVVTVTRGNSFTNGVVSPAGGGFDMNNRSRSKSKGKRNTENEDGSAIERAGKTKQAGKNEEHQRHRHRKHTKERDGLQKSGEPCVVDGNCFTGPSLNASADFREGTEMKQFGHRKIPNERESPTYGLQQHQFIIDDGKAPETAHKVGADSFPSDSSHPALAVEHRYHHHSDRHSRLVAKKTAPSHLHQPERASIDLQRPSSSLQRQPPSVPARPSRTAPPLAPGAGHPPLPAVEGEPPCMSGRPVKPSSSRSTPLPVLP